MQRVAFQLQIKEGKVEEYDEAHRHVWPALVAEMESFGVTEYSIFRRGVHLFLTLRVEDWDNLLRQLEGSEVNRQWQTAMAPLFEPVKDLLPGESFAMMQEVFYMRGAVQVDAVRAQRGELS